jgi:aspartyl-tRNA(Asn)/glutamyl-tRNA(Gln) amidotransferase subunit C
MKISEKEVEIVAELARLYLDEKDKKAMQKQLSSILDFVDKLNELNTDNVEPTAHILDITNVFRDDVVKPSPPTEEILKLAPKRKDNFIVVPKVI